MQREGGAFLDNMHWHTGISHVRVNSIIASHVSQTVRHVMSKEQHNHGIIVWKCCLGKMCHGGAWRACRSVFTLPKSWGERRRDVCGSAATWKFQPACWEWLRRGPEQSRGLVHVGSSVVHFIQMPIPILLICLLLTAKQKQPAKIFHCGTNTELTYCSPANHMLVLFDISV